MYLRHAALDVCHAVFVIQQLVSFCPGDGAPYNAWLHGIFTYVFAGGFSDFKLPEAIELCGFFEQPWFFAGHHGRIDQVNRGLL